MPTRYMSCIAATQYKYASLNDGDTSWEMHP